MENGIFQINKIRTINMPIDGLTIATGKFAACFNNMCSVSAFVNV